MQQLTKTAIEAALAGAAEIMDVYDNHDFQVQTKEDNSPLTIADVRAHNIIKSHLEKTGIPILSEEGAKIPYDERKGWSRFWLVDPLDGTKEFIKRNGEFTVNVALIENGTPVLGVVYAPVLQQIYFGNLEDGAFRAQHISPAETPDSILSRTEKLPVTQERTTLNVVASKSHLNEETKNHIAQMEQSSDRPVKTVSIGSSLKLCLVALGEADIYPRFGPTMEWDTGAGHAVVKAAGKKVMQVDADEELVYNKENLLNPFFVVK
ncbi:3'(2'),5'-bisphosphate nucleotidase [Marinilabilia salmonicolor]|jgi:3'(2'), 5'-bisphosphate nucleotidase|uniref:3'(2'),5'-bisphosphate nucleotidase CysQ n=1 Tax=Marinilabilia salmonicolor TaxID=989 RepID=UPI000D071199|nr:3'(2'),5'-bisphosphate nucleotidase CysQ [Marinilabilia salmonicolor]PRY95960.1 3'(2'),5'-bisphosphate nucleotidase [Marinilabilia salmonicolor]